MVLEHSGALRECFPRFRRVSQLAPPPEVHEARQRLAAVREQRKLLTPALDRAVACDVVWEVPKKTVKTIKIMNERLKN